MARPRGTPRRGAWWSILRYGVVAVWGLIVLWLVVLSLYDVLGIINPGPARWWRIVSVFRLWLNLWGLAGAAWLARLWRNPLYGTGTRRLLTGGLALGLLLGRLLTEGRGFEFGVSQLGFGLGVVLFALAPVAPFLVITLASMLIISVLGGVVMLVFSLVVGIPVALFNQLLQFDRAIHVYRYQERGLIGYIVRFGYWLRGEAMPPAPPDESRGARFATREEIEALYAHDDASSFGFGHREL